MANWDKIKTRGRVDDRRGNPGSMQGLPSFNLNGLGGSGLLMLLAVLGVQMLVGGGQLDLGSVLGQLESAQPTSSQVSEPIEDGYDDFAGAVLGSANETWDQIFKSSDKTYVEPTLVLFRGGTQSGCGFASSQVGPHYCPADETIYIDETFFDELVRRFGARGGDVAEAYVIAHEVAHHVQNRLGIMDTYGRSRDNQTSVNLELQADCFAGIWAHSIKDAGVFEPGEINEAIDAAEAVGDDRIQESVQGRVDPESWTHGSSEQRKQWFSIGFDTGDPSRCNTF